MTPSKFPQLKLQHYRQTDLLQSQRNLDRLFNPSYGIAVEPAMIANEPGDLNRPNLLGFRDAVHFQTTRALEEMGMAGIQPLHIGRVRERDDNHYRTVGIDGISTHNHDRPRPRLLTAFGRVETCAKNVTANGFWEGGHSLQPCRNLIS